MNRFVVLQLEWNVQCCCDHHGARDSDWIHDGSKYLSTNATHWWERWHHKKRVFADFSKKLLCMNAVCRRLKLSM